MNIHITRKLFIYGLATLASIVGVTLLFTNLLGMKSVSVKRYPTKTQNIIIQREGKKAVIDKFTAQSQVDSQVEFQGVTYTRPQKVYTDEEKIKILNNF